jgi:RNA polymerase sigma factor (TIGR02999 family)
MTSREDAADLVGRRPDWRARDSPFELRNGQPDVEVEVKMSPAKCMADDAPIPADGPVIAELLAAWASREPGARDRVVTTLYEELRRLARIHLERERPDHTLQPTALVNEVYLRLATLERMQWRDRGHFLAMMSTLMRRVLVDHARMHGRDKRGGGVSVTSLDGHDAPGPVSSLDIIALDHALAALATIDERQAQIVELRFFGGLTVEETAAALDLSPATVKREWASARAWLYQRIGTS